MVQSFNLSIINAHELFSLHYSDNNSESSSAIGGEIGGAIGGVLVLIIIIALVPILILCIRKSRKKKEFSISTGGHNMTYKSKPHIASLNFHNLKATIKHYSCP